MRVSGRLVRRYARALFEAAREANAVAGVGRDLGSIATALADLSLASTVLGASSDRASKKKAFEKAVPLETPLSRTFVDFLFQRRREDVLPALASAFAAEVDRAEGIVRGVVEAGRALPEEDRRALESALGASLGARVTLSLRVDPALVGGVRIEVAGRRLDATVPGRLAALREELLAAPLRQP
jgi:F-type H+-transporting ATPase subunit delta